MILEESQQQFASPEEALQHHGVKGMRWGDRKKEESVSPDASGMFGPKSVAKPVVPDKKLSPRKQAKVDKYLKDSKVMETRVSELKLSNQALAGSRNPSKHYDRMNNNQLIKQTEKQQKRAVRDAEAVQKGKLTSKQKKVVVGAVVVTAIVGYGAYATAQQSGALNSWKLMGKARLRGEKIPFAINKDLSKKMSAADLLAKVAKPVNPGYAGPGGKMNCRRSTYAYELRRRGFNVHATTSSMGYGQSESGVINALTTSGKDYFRGTSLSEVVRTTGFSDVASGDTRKAPGAKILLENLTAKTPLEAFRSGSAQSSSKAVLSELAKQPNGARGEVVFKFQNFGHSMAYEVVDGVPHIFDSQKGTAYGASKLVESKWDGFSAAEIRRLDNLDLDLNFLSRWATNSGG